MRKSALYGDILYNGLVAERNLILGDGFSVRTKNRLKMELLLWSKIIDRLSFEEVTEKDTIVLDDFLSICDKSPDIKKIYRNNFDIVKSYSYDVYKKITPDEPGSSTYKYRQVIIHILQDFVEMLDSMINTNNLFPPKKKIYKLINSVHNLPRGFLTESQVKENKSQHSRITFKTAIEYSLFYDTFKRMFSARLERIYQ